MKRLLATASLAVLCAISHSAPLSDTAESATTEARPLLLQISLPSTQVERARAGSWTLCGVLERADEGCLHSVVTQLYTRLHCAHDSPSFNDEDDHEVHLIDPAHVDYSSLLVWLRSTIPRPWPFNSNSNSDSDSNLASDGAQYLPDHDESHIANEINDASTSSSDTTGHKDRHSEDLVSTVDRVEFQGLATEHLMLELEKRGTPEKYNLTTAPPPQKSGGWSLGEKIGLGIWFGICGVVVLVVAMMCVTGMCKSCVNSCRRRRRRFR